MTGTEQQYRVIFGPVQIRLSTPVDHGGQRIGGMHVDQGGLLPPGVEPAQLQHLLSINMIEPVPPPTPPEPEPEQESEATGA